MPAKAPDKRPELSAADVIAAFEKAETLPDDAFSAGVVHAAAIAPAVVKVLHEAVRGTNLSDSQANLLFWGIHALGVARRRELYRPLLDLLRRCDEDETGRLLGVARNDTLASIVISVFDGHPAPLIEACADHRVERYSRWNLFGALARLTFDGAIPRETTIAFLDRFDRESLAGPEDHAWIGWQDVITLLGLEEMRERLSAACREGRFRQDDDDLEFALEQLESARSLGPGDDALFIEQDLVPLEDWAVPSARVADDADDDWDRADEDDDAPDEDDEDDLSDLDEEDPAEEFALSDAEIGELRGFITSPRAAGKIMALERIDGYFTALTMAPDRVRAIEEAAAIFECDDPSSCFEDEAQQNRFGELFVRHLHTILARLEGGYEHVPALDDTSTPAARVWAQGFVEGMQTAPDAWERYLRSGDDVTAYLGPLLTLSFDDGEERDGVRMTPDLRAELVPLIPSMAVALDAAVQVEEEAHKHRPARSTKVGRNEPCPCGSGKKYKRCCGSA